MNPALHIRLMTTADLAFADALRAAAGWNQTIEDWKRFLVTAPDGCFVAEWSGAPAGTATTICYGRDLAWIGMVLVDPSQRRRGIGRALLGHCVEHLRGRGVGCIKLDATPLGKELYDGLGFRDEWTLTRWIGAGPNREPAVPTAAGVRPWRGPDGAFVDALDTIAFGVSRRAPRERLAAQSLGAVVVESPTGAAAGYGLLRAGARALYLGPVAAESPEAGLRVLDALAAHCEGQRFIVDIPDMNAPAADWARRLGLEVERHLTRMVLGENASPGRADHQFAIAGPEVG